MIPSTLLLLLVVFSAIGGMLLLKLVHIGFQQSWPAAAFICCVILVELLILELYKLLPSNP